MHRKTLENGQKLHKREVGEVCGAKNRCYFLEEELQLKRRYDIKL
jgi:hypothetical protein